MVDGVLDLLTAILILGIVLSIAFGFILPLTRTEVMQYDTQYTDKGAIYETGREGLYTGYEDTIGVDAELPDTRYYTYEELMLLIDIQDDRLESPTVLSIRNLAGTVGNNATASSNISDVYLGVNPDKTKEVVQRNIDNGDSLNYLFEKADIDSFFRALLMSADNHGYVDVEGDYQVGYGNQGFITLGTGVFKEEKADIAKYFGRVRDLLNTNNTGNYFVNIHNPVKNNRIYAIKYHFLIPDDSIYIKDGGKRIGGDSLTRTYDEDNMWWVEVKGTFRGKEVDTFSDYQEFLRKARDLAG